MTYIGTPAPDLTPFIESCWSLSSQGKSGFAFYETFPDSNVKLIFRFSSSACRMVLMGPMTEKTTVEIDAASDYFGFLFRPGQAPRLADVHPAKLLDGYIDIHEIQGESIKTLAKRLLRLSDHAERQLIVALLDTLEIDRAGIVAISGGGPCAIFFALRYPDRCAGLALVSCSSGKSDVPIPLAFHLKKFLARFPLIVRFLKRKALAKLDKDAANPDRCPEVRRRMLADEETMTLARAIITSFFDRMAERVPGTDNDIRITRTIDYPLEDIRVPALVVHGTNDEALDFEQHGKVLAARIPQAQLLAIKEGGHSAVLTHRGIAHAAIVRFFQSGHFDRTSANLVS